MRKKLILITILFAVVSCRESDPCDQCYDAEYYYEHPYECQECLQDQENEASLMVEEQTGD